VVAIDGALFFHKKYLVAIGGHSIATLNIMVAIGETLYCNDKYLVARGGVSITTINSWLLFLDRLLQHLLFHSYEFFATPFVCCYNIFCNTADSP
jgi:hypothetical protein